ncbi:MAG: hypothetical protein MSH11_05020 [Ruminococcus sp.]|nr:hypothetical protein [Ruminococcus sp.]
MQDFFDFNIVTEQQDDTYIPSEEDLSVLNDFYDEPIGYERQPQAVAETETPKEEEYTAVNSTVIDFLHNTINTRDDKERVKVVPLPCGTGKTTYIQYLIRQIASQCRYVEGEVKCGFNFNDGGNGVLIVTDRVRRLDEYFGGRESDFFHMVRLFSTVITESNSITAFAEQYNKPILLMTTQRYLSLTKEEINNLSSWRGGCRTKIIIDESVDTFRFPFIDNETLEKVSIALHKIPTVFNGTNINEEREWVISEWKSLSETLLKDFCEFEKIGTNTVYLWYKPNLISISRDDNRFFSLINSRKNNELKEVYNHILSVKNLIEEGGLFTCSKLRCSTDSVTPYHKGVFIISSNMDKLTNLNASVFILDGTAEIDCRYNLKNVEILNVGESFSRAYPMLNINFVNLKTNKSYIAIKNKEDRRRYIELIKDYSKQIRPDVIFTYLKFEKEFDGIANGLSHFGNIDGSNDFRERTNFVQVGINRLQPVQYLLRYLATRRDCLYRLKEKPIQEQNIFLNKLRNYLKEDSFCKGCSFQQDDCLKTVVMYSLARDLEQAILRSKIRNKNCNDNVTYTVLIDTVSYADLISIITDRFPKATINVLPKPTIFVRESSLSRKGDTHYKRILGWLSSKESGYKFKKRELINDINISVVQLKNAIQRNEDLKKLFSDMKVRGKNEYVVL